METKLKALKVVELKDILSKAAVAVPAKANKSDLINRVIANPKALQIYNTQFSHSKPPTPPPPPQNDDLLAPPEDVDWNSDGAELPDPKHKAVKPSPATSTPVKQAAKPPPSVVTPPEKPSTAPLTNTTAPVSSSNITKTAEDEELEKRKQRAARFGVPLVEPHKPRLTPAKKHSTNRTQRVSGPPTTMDDTEKLVARSARFGKATVPSLATKAGRKRPISGEEVDAEELERRRKRAERFAIKPVDMKP